jgi:hypothetical protein
MISSPVLGTTKNTNKSCACITVNDGMFTSNGILGPFDLKKLVQFRGRFTLAKQLGSGAT